MIVGKRVQLRAIEFEDLRLLAEWRNDQEIYQYFFEHEPLSLVSQKRWFEIFLKNANEKFWIIETIEHREPIGTVAFLHIDWRNQKSELGRFLISPNNLRSSGYGSEVLQLVIRYAFEHMNLSRLYVQLFLDNVHALNFYKKHGFKKEGVLRQHIFNNGRYKNVATMALLREDYFIEQLERN